MKWGKGKEEIWGGLKNKPSKGIQDGGLVYFKPLKRVKLTGDLNKGLLRAVGSSVERESLVIKVVKKEG